MTSSGSIAVSSVGRDRAGVPSPGALAYKTACVTGEGWRSSEVVLQGRP